MYRRNFIRFSIALFIQKKIPILLAQNEKDLFFFLKKIMKRGLNVHFENIVVYLSIEQQFRGLPVIFLEDPT